MDDIALTKLICAQLVGIPSWVRLDEPGAPYPDGDGVGIFYGALDAAPDRAVGVRVYNADDARLEHFAVRRVQLRFRGAKDRRDGADELASTAFAVLQGLSRVGGISGVSRLSIAPLGADGNRREERTDNYTIILDNQEAHS